MLIKFRFMKFSLHEVMKRLIKHDTGIIFPRASNLHALTKLDFRWFRNFRNLFETWFPGLDVLESDIQTLLQKWSTFFCFAKRCAMFWNVYKWKYVCFECFCFNRISIFIFCDLKIKLNLFFIKSIFSEFFLDNFFS